MAQRSRLRYLSIKPLILQNIPVLKSNKNFNSNLCKASGFKAGNKLSFSHWLVFVNRWHDNRWWSICPAAFQILFTPVVKKNQMFCTELSHLSISCLPLNTNHNVTVWWFCTYTFLMCTPCRVRWCYQHCHNYIMIMQKTFVELGQNCVNHYYLMISVIDANSTHFPSLKGDFLCPVP